MKNLISNGFQPTLHKPIKIYNFFAGNQAHHDKYHTESLITISLLGSPKNNLI